MDTLSVAVDPARESTADELDAVFEAWQRIKAADPTSVRPHAETHASAAPINWPAEFRAFSQSHCVEPEIVECFLDFWWPLLEKDGRLDLSQVMRELYDYRTALSEVGKEYVHLTNGKFSKPNTAAEYIIAAVEENYSDTSE